MRINTNITAMNTYTQYTKNNNKIANSVSKLSSGYAINSAADNAAGLAISEKMRAQIRGLNQAATNSQDAISLIQTAEGALSSSTEILQRMRELAVQSANDTNENKIDREALQDEFKQLQSELDDISKTTSFNKKNLLDGSLATKKNTVTNTQLGNNSLAISLGNASAGAYNFSVKVKQETAAIAAQKPTDQQATFGNTASNYFEVNTGAASNGLATNAAVTVALGSNASESALLNGNYSMSATMNEDGSMTVTATGDNDQTFTATVSSNQLTNLATASSAGGGTVTGLKLQFSASADDAFSVSLGVKNFSNTENGKNTLMAAIEDTTVSVTGGVTAQDATYGVYASMTGGNDVKLYTGDTSVTFDNGVTVSFNELTAADLDTKNQNTLTAASALGMEVTTTAAANVAGSKVSYSNLKVSDDAHLDAGTANFAVANGTGTNVKFTLTDASGNAFEAEYTQDQLNALTIDSANANMTAAASDRTKTLTLTLNAADGSSVSIDVTNEITADAASGTAASVAANTTALLTPTSATSFTVTNATGHNYSKVFGDGTNAANGVTDKGASSFTVNTEKNEGLTFQVGANSGDELVINIDKLDCEYLGVNSAKVSSQDAASAAIKAVDDAINQVSTQRSYLGAIQNRLDYKINNLETSSENLTSAESQIRDVDMAKEMTKFTSANILSQAATAMLAQANSLPQNVLSLIG